MADSYRDRELLPFRRGERQTLLETRVFDVTEREVRSRLEPSRGGRYIELVCPEWVNVIARTDGGDLVFVEQWRNGPDSMTLEIPGGLVDEGEPPLSAALRELREETGYGGGRAELLGFVHPNPALQGNRCWTAFVDGVTLQGEQQLDGNEEIAVHLVPEGEVSELIRGGRVSHSLVIAAFHLWSLRG